MIQSRRVLLAIIVIITIVGIFQNAHNLNDFRGGNNEFDWATGGAPPPPLRPHTTEEEYFWENTEDCSSCIYVDNVCSDNTGWFYAPPQYSAYQPTIKLVYDRKELATTHVYLHGLQVNEEIQFDISSTSHVRYNDTTTCSYASVPYHLVVQSAYNEMIGEFYSRTILPLNQWMRDFPATTRRSAAAAAKEDIQIYVHFVDRRKELFHGHKLFLGGLANNNIYHNLLSLMPNKDDEANNNCQCYKKIIFCGYKIKNVTTTSMNFENSNSIEEEEETTFTITPGSQITNPKTENYDIHDISVDPIYNNLRKDLINTYYRKDPYLNEKIVQYQMRILIDKGIIVQHTNNTYNISSSIDIVKEWKFVGLTHRKYRRVWLNINDILSICEEKFHIHKIICILIDVENANSAEEQLVMHRSLHAIIGVHGAQLTQGILVTPHAYILELLPWVPYYLWGGWVATTHSPTPLGVIYHRTDINHIGYPLGRDSVPLCLHVNTSDIETDRLCLMNSTTGVLPKFRWADRDYIVPPHVIEDFVTTYLLKTNDSNDEKKEDDYCDEMQRQAEETSFVLYNVYCKLSNHSNYIAKQYYRKENWMLPKKINNAFGAVY
jgi:hypothetical protein